MEEEMHSVTVRLNEAHYGRLVEMAQSQDLSPTSFAREIIVEAVGEPETAGIDEVEQGTSSDPSCIRAARHEAGVPCPICQAA